MKYIIKRPPAAAPSESEMAEVEVELQVNQWGGLDLIANGHYILCIRKDGRLLSTLDEIGQRLNIAARGPEPRAGFLWSRVG